MKIQINKDEIIKKATDMHRLGQASGMIMGDGITGALIGLPIGYFTGDTIKGIEIGGAIGAGIGTLKSARYYKN